jgi:RNA polymerase sigma-70 factor (ECF subfamily)
MIRVRLDPRVRSRIDPSDVVQDTFLVAATRLATYAATRPLPFYPWLRQIAVDRLIDIHRRDVVAKKRSVAREEVPTLSRTSSLNLARRLVSATDEPDAKLQRQDEAERVRVALTRLKTPDQEILIMRYLEDLTTTETASALGIKESTAKVRLLRAIQRLRRVLDETSPLN